MGWRCRVLLGQSCQKSLFSSKPITIWSLSHYLEGCHGQQQIVSAVLKLLFHTVIIFKFKIVNYFLPKQDVFLYYYYHLESTVLDKSCKKSVLLENFYLVSSISLLWPIRVQKPRSQICTFSFYSFILISLQISILE